MRDRGFIEDLINRAKAAGCEALVLTLDLQVLGQRHKDIKNGLSAPPKPTLKSIADLALRPQWCLGMLGTKNRTFGNIVGHAPGVTNMGTSAEVSGAAHLPAAVAGAVLGASHEDRAATLLRLEGFADSVGERLDRLKPQLGTDRQIAELDAAASRSAWTAIRDVHPFADGGDDPVWRISVAPMAGHAVAARLLDALPGQAYFDWQGGLVWLRLTGDSAHVYYNGHRGYHRYRHGYRRHHGYWFPHRAFVVVVPRYRYIPVQPYHPPRAVHPRIIRLSHAHKQWCEHRYRSYRLRDNTFQPYHGPRRPCVSPYY